MIVFRSKAGADVMMLQGHGETVLRALGRQPATQGIFLPEQQDEALQAFAQAQAQVLAEAEPRPTLEANDALPGEEADPDLGRRAWPLLELLRAARAKGVAVTWSSS